MLGLRSKLRRDLLRQLFTNPEEEHYLRELARLLHADPANLHRELAALAREGVVRWQQRGQHKFYRVNRAHPLFGELRRIVMKTVGVEGLLRDLVSRLEGIEQAYLFGSFASHQQDAESDIDLLLVGDPNEAELASRVRALEKQLRREINYTLLSAEEFRSRKKKRDAFLASALRRKVNLLAA